MIRERVQVRPPAVTLSTEAPEAGIPRASFATGDSLGPVIGEVVVYPKATASTVKVVSRSGVASVPGSVMVYGFVGTDTVQTAGPFDLAPGWLLTSGPDVHSPCDSFRVARFEEQTDVELARVPAHSGVEYRAFVDLPAGDTSHGTGCSTWEDDPDNVVDIEEVEVPSVPENDWFDPTLFVEVSTSHPPDSVYVGEEGFLNVYPINAAGDPDDEYYFPQNAPTTVTAHPSVYADIGVGSQWRPSKTVQYKNADDLKVRARADSAGNRPRYDATVRLLGSLSDVDYDNTWGEIKGASRIVIPGENGPGPDTLVVSLGAASLPCGDSTRVSVQALLKATSQALPLDSSRVARIIVTDTLRTELTWWDPVLGDSSGTTITVPWWVVAQDSSAVWIRTVNCADVQGDIPIGVRVEVDVPWLPEPLVGEAEGTLVPPPRDRLVITLEPAAIEFGERARVVVEALGADDQPLALNGTATVTLGVSPASAEAWGQFAWDATGQVIRLGPAAAVQWYEIEGTDLYFFADSTRPPSTQTFEIVVDYVARADLADSAQLTLDVPPVDLRLLSQDASYFPTPQAGGALLPSRFPTDHRLPAEVSFEYASNAVHPDPFKPGDPGDVYTARPQLIGIGSGQPVAFRITAGPRTVTYGATEGTEGGAVAYRADRHVRLVADAVDDAHNPGSFGDPDQTLLVQVGDLVRIEARDALADTAYATLDYTVGHPAGSGLPYEPLGGTLNWRWAGSTPIPQVADVRDRINGEWAQAAVVFANKDPQVEPGAWGSYVPVRNVLEVTWSNGRTTAPSSGSVTIEGVTVSFTQGQTLNDFVNNHLSPALASGLSGPVSVHPNSSPNQRSGLFRPADEARGWHIVVGRAPYSPFGSDRYSTTGLDVRRLQIEPRGLELWDSAALIKSVQDSDPSTVDVVVVERDGLRRMGSDTQGMGFDDSPERFGLINALIVGAEVVEANTDYPLVPSHEVGHVMGIRGHTVPCIQQPYPADVFGVGCSAGTPYNDRHLMYGTTGGQTESVGSSKRMHEEFAGAARSRGQLGIPILFPIAPSNNLSAQRRSVPAASDL